MLAPDDAIANRLVRPSRRRQLARVDELACALAQLLEQFLEVRLRPRLSLSRRCALQQVE
jgi:hypothetical protein